MPLWPLPTASKRGQYIRTDASTITANVTTNTTTAHSMGTWQQLISSTTEDTDLIVIRHNGHNSTGVASPALMDIGVGGSGAETTVIPYIDIGNQGYRSFSVFPINLPAGTRISARVQGARTNVAIATGIDTYGGMNIVGGSLSSQKWTAYGVDAANSRGTLIDIPASANTWSSWTQIEASTDYDHDLWVVSADTGAATTVRGVNVLVQVAAAPTTGAADTVAASGVCLYEMLFATTTSEAIDLAGLMVPRYNPVPAGSVLYARAQSSSATNNDIYVCIYGGS